MPSKQPVIDIKIQQKVRDVIVQICKNEAEKIMDGLIEKHPTWTGKTFRNSNRGSNQYQVRARMEFGFENNKEAEVLENGTEAKPFSGTFVQNVPGHKRELGKPKGRRQKIIRRVLRKKPRNIMVKKHTRTYINMKPVLLPSGEWRILSGTPAQKKKQPVYKAFDKIITNEQYLASQIKLLLKL